MQKITNIKFLSLEFDFGYDKNFEETYESKGRIDAVVFVEIENGGSISTITHKVALQDVSFDDFLIEEDKNEIIKEANSFSEYIQVLRKLIALKVANDLNIEVADMEYVIPRTLRSEVDGIKEETMGLQQAIAELTMMMTTSQ